MKKTIAGDRYLFVCVGNVDRSKAAEDVCTSLLRELNFIVGKFEDKKGSDFYIGSAGIQVSAPNILNGSVQLTEQMARRASRVFSLDERVTRCLRKEYCVSSEKVIPMYVEDGRSLLVEEQACDLYAELRRKLKKYIHE